ncbi:MAG: carboxylesterase/lipase family protein, partial [Lachnospiraceae bacterium]|nr:carboxylesterase/lipase family protein [Lachnospiraceae bacterium]
MSMLMEEANVKECVCSTEYGKVQGYEKDGQEVYLAIPYGGAVDGAWRFLPPVKPEAWEGVLDCGHFRHKAMQAPSVPPEMMPEGLREKMVGISAHFAGGIDVSKTFEETPDENCLYLNVVTPGSDDKKRPVLFYIHGGAFYSGTGNVAPLISERLVAEEDIVLVSVNHRLNAFGFLYLGGFDPAYKDSGISGMLDLVLALQWVRDNIANFGGDPNCVTIMGESGGGMKVETLMSMPEASGLFHRAIAVSGSKALATQSREEAHEVTKALLKKLGIAEENWREILNVPAQEIFAAISEGNAIVDKALSFEPVADGIRLPENPDRKFFYTDVSKDIPFLVGSSEDELAFFFPTISPEMTMEEMRGMLLSKTPEMQALFPKISEKNVDKLIETVLHYDKPDKTPAECLLELISLAHFLGGGSYRAACAKASQEGGAPVYFY